MQSEAVERRSTPRIAVRCAGELASGTSVMDIVISDMSVTGCGVEIEGVPDDVLGQIGVLSVHAQIGTPVSVLLPIVICHNRVEGGRTRLGLKFRPLNTAQVRHLVAIMHDNGLD